MPKRYAEKVQEADGNSFPWGRSLDQSLKYTTKFKNPGKAAIVIVLRIPGWGNDDIEALFKSLEITYCMLRSRVIDSYQLTSEVVGGFGVAGSVWSFKASSAHPTSDLKVNLHGFTHKPETTDLNNIICPG